MKKMKGKNIQFESTQKDTMLFMRILSVSWTQKVDLGLVVVGVCRGRRDGKRVSKRALDEHEKYNAH